MICLICGKEFKRKWNSQKYCLGCKKIAYRQKGKELEKKLYWLNPAKYGKRRNEFSKENRVMINGKLYYKNWLTHMLFHIECIECKTHWRTVIPENPEKDIFFELISSDNSKITKEFENRKLPLEFWKDLIIEKIDKKIKI